MHHLNRILIGAVVALLICGAEGALFAAAASAAEIHSLSVRAVEVLTALFQPAGFNIGWNLGRDAGAGIVDHVHEHVVPRWQGDTNFMPVLADVRVIPEHLQVTHTRVEAAWSE